MMFKRVSYAIALQFTTFVFVLLLINGIIFLAADFANVRRQTHGFLVQNLQQVLSRSMVGMDGLPSSLPAIIRERVRIADVLGRPVYAGGLFVEVPFSSRRGVSSAIVEGERYVILTAPVMHDGQLTGYIQIAHLDRFHFGELPLRSLLYFLVSLIVSALTFFVGLFFARRSLKPAEHMMERLEQFTQDASHELRTPLATLNSSLDLALKTKKYREGIVSAKEDVQQVSALVERLLALARLGTFVLAKEPVDLSGLIADAVEKHRPLAEEKMIVLESAIEPTISVKGDASLLRQVIGNLLSNAIKYSKPGGGFIRITLTKEKLSVGDRGIGISKEALPHVFDRFYQEDSSRAKGGCGLGLALVKRIVDLHGWTVHAQSKEGEETTFTVRFSSQREGK